MPCCRMKIVNEASPVIYDRINGSILSLQPQTALPAYASRRRGAPTTSRGRNCFGRAS